MKKQNKLTYNRTLKLPAALGDWTTLQAKSKLEDVINISPVQSVSFDSLPRQEMQELHIQHYKFADKLIKLLSKDMEIKIELHTVHAEQVSYEQFLKTQKDVILQSDFYIKNKGRVNLIFEWGLAEIMVNRLVGGKGKVEGSQQTFTELEKVALEVQMESVIALLSESWGSAINEADLSLDFNMGYYRYDKKVALRQAYVIFSYDLFFMDEKVYKVIMAYPSDLVRQLMNQQYQDEPSVKPNINLEVKTLRKTKIPIKVELGKTELTMEQLKSLKVGSIVMLNSSLNQPLSVKIGKGNFWMQLGEKDGQLAVQILEAHKKQANLQREFLIPNKISQKTDMNNQNIIESDQSNMQISASIENNENIDSKLE